jgi:hypothetical protein
MLYKMMMNLFFVSSVNVIFYNCVACQKKNTYDVDHVLQTAGGVAAKIERAAGHRKQAGTASEQAGGHIEWTSGRGGTVGGRVGAAQWASARARHSGGQARRADERACRGRKLRVRAGHGCRRSAGAAERRCGQGAGAGGAQVRAGCRGGRSAGAGGVQVRAERRGGQGAGAGGLGSWCVATQRELCGCAEQPTRGGEGLQGTGTGGRKIKACHSNMHKHRRCTNSTTTRANPVAQRGVSGTSNYRGALFGHISCLLWCCLHARSVYRGGTSTVNSGQRTTLPPDVAHAHQSAR